MKVLLLSKLLFSQHVFTAFSVFLPHLFFCVFSPISILTVITFNNDDKMGSQHPFYYED